MIDDHSSTAPGVPVEESLFGDVTTLIEAARGRVAITVNAELTMLYWGIGRRIREDVLGLEKPEYGRAVVTRLAERLTVRYGRGYSRSRLFRMVQFAAIYESREIVAPLARQLTWSHLLQLIALENTDERRFYEALAARDRWSKRELARQIQRRLYQRALAGRDPAALAADLADVVGGDTAPTLALRDPYVLDFLGLDSAHSEADLERAIIDEMQRFLLELGTGFAFVARQKRVTVDGDDYYLDLLFHHYVMRCFVAVELKTRKLQPGDKGQMELYLRWLDRYERVPGDEAPIGLILCTSKGPQQTALLGLDSGEIRAARYITEPMRDEMRRRLVAAAGQLGAGE
ncbi:MAG: PDDEXK nuclease domain-containing protein [Coriobacteriia bacterium]|nr:PDDEXK nuclease domain-containing protein [Coriobacteriia bacterium]